MASIFQDLGIPESDLVEARKIVARYFTSNFGERYRQYLAAVGAALLKVFPPAAAFAPEELIDIIAVTDVIGPDSRAIMKRLKEACNGCGWCCSKTRRIVVEEEDTVRISRKLKTKKENLFTRDGQIWIIKKSQPCGWWNPKNGRCQIYNERPAICRSWPLGSTDAGLPTIHPVPQCNYSVMVTVNKVIWALKSAETAGQPAV
jgi:Fe-S-cluster containining protein